MRWLSIALVLLALILLFGFAASIKIGVWNECRDAGHSGWYCLMLVNR